MDINPEENTPETLRELIVKAQLELSPSGVTVIDVDERIVFWNQRFLDIWGLKEEDLTDTDREVVIQKVISDVKNPDAFYKMLEVAYSDRSYRGTDILEFGDAVFIERKTVSLNDRDGVYHGRIWFFTDITQQKVLERRYENYASELQRMVSTRTQELIEAERLAASGALASEIAHDLRSPLQSIRNASYMMKRDPDKIGVGLEIIEKSVLRSLEMLEEMRRDTKKAEPNFFRTNLNGLIQETLDELPKPNDISLHLEMDAVEDAWLDATQIRRVLDNILLNAVEAMPGGGDISVTKHFVDGKFLIQISDTGMGIPEEVLPNLLERKFYTTKPHGLGLGLSFCKRTVESHGGNIMVDSVLGKGTIFTIEIPLID